MNQIIQHEYPGLLSMMAFDLASDILLHEALLSLINNKHIYSLKMEDERFVLTTAYKVERSDEDLFFLLQYSYLIK